jgi:hypothetical protein
MSSGTRDRPELLLRGIDGSNPLAFLAALGTLRGLTRARPDSVLQMSWQRVEGAWRPLLHGALERRDITPALLTQCQATTEHPTLAIADDLTINPEQFRTHARARIAGGDRESAAYIAAFGSDAITNKSGNIADTALRTMSGAGHQHFLKTIRDVLRRVSEEQIARALFSEWDYADPLRGLSLRLDPLDDKRYALQWINPSDDQTRGSRGNMLGANALAVLGIPLLAVAPVHDELRTTGFRGSRGSEAFWTWPIWECTLSLDVVSSLLTHADLQEKQPPRDTLLSLGVVDIFRSRRITTDKFRNFTPAMAI